MKVLVCGGRDFRWRNVVDNALDRFDAKHGIDILITGAAKGADQLAENWAKSRQIQYIGVPARWQERGRKAGPIRNSEILDIWRPDCVIAFPGGTGTADMVRKAKIAGLDVWEVECDDDFLVKQ